MPAFSRTTMSARVDEIELCPECSSMHLEEDYSRGELVCANCGLVVKENIIDPGQEWRNYDTRERDDKARTGGPVTFTLHDKGLPNEISWRNVDVYGKRVPARNKSQLYRIRGLQRRLRIANSTERNLMVAFCTIDRICSNMSLPKTTRENASVIYRRAMLKGIVKGRSVESVAAVSIYVAARRMNIPRTIEEIAKSSGSTEKDISRTYRIVARKLRLFLQPTIPQDYISRFCSELHLDPGIEAKALEILAAMEGTSASIGKGPQGSAAAAIYMAAIMLGSKKTQERVAAVSGVTEATLRNRMKDMEHVMAKGAKPHLVAIRNGKIKL